MRLITSALVAAATSAALAAPPEASTPLTLELRDFATLPITGKLDGAGQVDGMLARVNSIREEPGGSGRLFVTDMNGPIYILDKKTRALTTYLDFNGRDNRPGLFDRFFEDPGYSSGVSQFEFDPDYRRNGKFYTVHMENPVLPGSQRPDSRNAPGLKFGPFGYEPTAAVTTPGPIPYRVDPRRMDGYESSELDVRRNRTRDPACAAQPPYSPDGRNGLPSRGATRRSGMARDVHRPR